MKGDRRLILWGGLLLGLMILLAAGADRLAATDPIEPTDPVVGRFLPPGSSRAIVRLADGSKLLADRARATESGVEIERLGERRLIAPAEVESGDPVAALGRRVFPLGTDRFGRDVWSRLLHGARTSLWIGVVAAALALTLGVLVGGIAASAGRATDALLMRITDALLAFPHLFIVIALAAVFNAGQAVIILILGATGWMGTARLIRAEILGLRQREFVLAANAVGLRRRQVFFRHLLPNALTPVIAYTALRVGDLILVEASLSFLGLGVPAPQPTWGNMIAQGSDVLTTAWWVATFPGAAIAVTVIAFHLVGDGLRAWLDPRAR